jgi:hypothetical protein
VFVTNDDFTKRVKVIELLSLKDFVLLSVPGII